MIIKDTLHLHSPSIEPEPNDSVQKHVPGLVMSGMRERSGVESGLLKEILFYIK